jgi:hypothetical protein
MASYDDLNKHVRELIESRFKQFERGLLSGKAETERNAEYQKKRLKRRREFMASTVMDLKKFDAAVEHENRMFEAEVKAFLEEYRPKSANRPSAGVDVSKDAAIRSGVLAQSGHMVLPVFVSSIFTADKKQFDGVVGIGPNKWTDGAINSGWVFPDDPSRIRIRDSEHDESLCWPNHYFPPPEFATHFTFVPASTGTYEMTAVLGFHGFYVLVSDDSWWNCRFAYVRLTAQMNVHQYVDSGWKDFPPLLQVEKQNAQEVDNFDRTFFLDYTAALRVGDPVVVTVKGVVEAFSHGGGTYAELNFADGTANYIEPLLLSVQQV